jgi:sulfide:quinone oxidoreductase
MVANKLRPQLANNDWKITLVDEDEIHYYQPGFIFIPFGIYQPHDVIKQKRRFLPDGVNLLIGKIDRIEAAENQVRLADGRMLDYDYLVIASGTHPRPDETPGLEGDAWHNTIHDFYTYEGAVALASKLKNWEGGRFVVSIMEFPFKCPVAPLEFIFLADAYFNEKGMRDRVELTLVTPLSGAFTKPVAERMLSQKLAERNIQVVADFYTERVDTENNIVLSYDEEEVPFDLLVTVPVNKGAEFVARSGLGDELNHVKVDKETFLSPQYNNIFALGDAAALPTSKAGSVAHFAVDIFAKNFIELVHGRPMTYRFDGHANCFIESGYGKGILIDFNYDVEPLPGKFPIPGVGPFDLLTETRVNHWGKLAFRWMYWNLLLKGRPIPLVPSEMKMIGKEQGDRPAEIVKKF